MKADIRIGASLLKPWASSLPCHDPFSGKNMQQNLKSWCTRESFGLILPLANFELCSAVTVMIHESNTKHCFFWAWSPRSRRRTAHICSKCIKFRAKLVPVTYGAKAPQGLPHTQVTYTNPKTESLSQSRHSWWTLQLQRFFVKAVLCFARDLSERALKVAKEMKADIRIGASLLKPWASSLPCHDPFSGKNMQQNLKSWCTRESFGLILPLANFELCSAVTVMIHESNTKHCFFWAWSPRSRRRTAHICSKCIKFRAKLVPVTYGAKAPQG